MTEQNHISKGTVMFASQVTMEFLRVTLASVRDLTKDLLARGERYMLTGKLNQDPLESFFGMTRSFGGDEDRPTILSFAHLYRLLILYTPVNNCISGNVAVEPTVVLAAVQETMKKGKKDRLASHKRLQETIKGKLAKMCASTKDEATDVGASTAADHGYSVPVAQDFVIYYLCSYLVHSFLKHEKCTGCITDMQSTNACYPEAYLTLEREFKQGSLKRPSWKLFKMFQGIESQISSMLEKNCLCVDTFWTLLDAIKDCAVSSIGCSAHKDILTGELLHSYMVLRMHFATEDECKKMGAEKVSLARKKAKLL